jgi:hypothetical protein
VAGHRSRSYFWLEPPLIASASVAIVKLYMITERYRVQVSSRLAEDSQILLGQMNNVHVSWRDSLRGTDSIATTPRILDPTGTTRASATITKSLQAGELSGPATYGQEDPSDDEREREKLSEDSRCGRCYKISFKPSRSSIEGNHTDSRTQEPFRPISLQLLL